MLGRRPERHTAHLAADIARFRAEVAEVIGRAKTFDLTVIPLDHYPWGWNVFDSNGTHLLNVPLIDGVTDYLNHRENQGDG